MFFAACIFINTLYLNASTQANRKKLSVQNENFLKEFIPLAEQASKEVLKERLGIVLIKSFYEHTNVFSPKALDYVNSLAVKYKTDTLQSNLYNFDDFFENLLLRVDEVPAKMITAQAILESGWGRSKAARKTNNFFGITQKSKVGYFVTYNEATNTTFYLKTYNSMQDGIEDFVYNLNTHYAYAKFRELRKTSRDAKEKLKAQELTQGIMRYSEMKERYINKVNVIINKYIPENLEPYISN